MSNVRRAHCTYRTHCFWRADVINDALAACLEAPALRRVAAVPTGHEDSFCTIVGGRRKADAEPVEDLQVALVVWVREGLGSGAGATRFDHDWRIRCVGGSRDAERGVFLERNDEPASVIKT
jgi:hypothetical protein